MTQQRLDRIEDEFETVKQLLASAANYAQSAHEGLDELTRKQDRTQRQLDQLSVKQDRTQEQLDQLSVKVDNLAIAQEQTEATLNGFIAYAQQQFVQQAERIEQLEAIAVGLDRNFLEFQRTTTAALERMDRILDYLLRQQQSGL